MKMRFSCSMGVVVLVLGLLVQGAVHSEGLHFNITSVEVSPYVVKNDNVSATGEEYVGFIPDLLREISKKMIFTYDLKVRSDGQYGREEGGTWTGMVGEVMRGEADLAAAPLTISTDRDEVIDFTWAFLSFEAVAVMRERRQNQEPIITSFKDIVNSEEIKAGVTKSSTLSKVLQESKNDLANKLWKDLTLDPSSFKKSAQEGIDTARERDDFAFIMDGITADWVLRKKPCDLISFPTGLYKRKYAFALPQGSEHRDRFNKAIADLQFDGVIEDLYKKWWGEDECSASWRVSPSISLISTLLATILVFFMR